MDSLASVATVLATIIGAVALWFQIKGHRRRGARGNRVSGSASGSGVVVSVANSFPTWADRVGDWYVTVKTYNGGDRPVTVEAWGFELPGGGSLFQARPIPWAPRLPHRLEPGDKVEFFMPEAGLRQSLTERNLRFAQTKSWVRLASDEKIYGPAAPVQDE